MGGPVQIISLSWPVKKGGNLEQRLYRLGAVSLSKELTKGACVVANIL